MKAFMIQQRFSYDMKLAVRPDVFNFLSTFVHEWNMFIKAKFRVNQNTKQCFFCAELKEKPSGNDSVGVFKLNNRWHFSGLAFRCETYQMWTVRWNLLYQYQEHKCKVQCHQHCFQCQNLQIHEASVEFVKNT